MLSSWKKSACAGRAQSTDSSHRSNIGEEEADGPRRSERHTEHRVPVLRSHLFPLAGGLLNVGDAHHSPLKRRRGAWFVLGGMASSGRLAPPATDRHPLNERLDIFIRKISPFESNLFHTDSAYRGNGAVATFRVVHSRWSCSYRDTFRYYVNPDICVTS